MYFEPKRKDGRPLWRVTYDAVVEDMTVNKREPGYVFSHGWFKEKLEEDNEKYDASMVNEAAKRLRETHKRSLQSVRGKGYMLVAGVGQVEQGRKHRKRADRQLKRALSIVKSSDRKMMDPEDRKWADRVEGGLVALATIAKQHEEKLMAMAEDLDAVKEKQADSELRHQTTEEVLQELKERMERMEREKNARPRA